MATAYEFLKMCESVCHTLDTNGIPPSDVRYLKMYADWVRMRAEGHKYAYIAYYLTTQYGVSETSLYRIVKRMEKQLSL